MLKYRSDEIEIMDDLEISGPVVPQTLKELNTINKWLGGNSISISAFKKMAEGKQSIKLVDLGCGGGDIMMEMAKWARKKNINASFIGIDANPHIIEYAKENTSSFPEISYQAINIFSEEFEKQTYDIVHCCLFTHHFTDMELVKFFKLFKQQSKVGVIINDLHRHPLAYWSIILLISLFSKSEMVKNDASVSVARSFRKNEIRKILERADVKDYSLRWKWAFRWELTF
jgi:2-polyprenyl-3-methyl-5-hydroxy-6-metoxy-1,4-benzoquinol methylase